MLILNKHTKAQQFELTTCLLFFFCVHFQIVICSSTFAKLGLNLLHNLMEMFKYSSYRLHGLHKSANVVQISPMIIKLS